MERTVGIGSRRRERIAMKRRKRSATCERPFALVRPAATFQSGFSTLRPVLVRFAPFLAVPDRVGQKKARVRRNAGRATDRVRRSRSFGRPGRVQAL
jgi:hypothetical protein